MNSMRKLMWQLMNKNVSKCTCKQQKCNMHRNVKHMCSASLVPRPHPLTRRSGLVTQVDIYGLEHTFATMWPSNDQNILWSTCSKKVRILPQPQQPQNWKWHWQFSSGSKHEITLPARIWWRPTILWRSVPNFWNQSPEFRSQDDWPAADIELYWQLTIRSRWFPYFT